MKSDQVLLMARIELLFQILAQCFLFMAAKRPLTMMSRRPRALYYTLSVLPSTEIKLTMNQVYNIVNININFLSIITHTLLPYREPLERSDVPVDIALH